MAKDMDEFLGDEEPTAVADDSPPPPVEVEAEAAPEPEAPEKPEPEAKAEPEEPADPEDTTGLRKALTAERKQRQDYKGERDRLAGELAARQQAEADLRKQVDELMRLANAPPPAAPTPPPAPVPMPNPAVDPVGYANYFEHKLAMQQEANERRIITERMNISQLLLQREVSPEEVQAKVDEFKILADKDKSLQDALLMHPDPYRFAYETVQRHAAMNEIGTDPAAFRTRIEAEIRAKIEAEMGIVQQAPSAAPRPQLPQSLSGVRSAGARSTPVMNVPESFADILGQK